MKEKTAQKLLLKVKSDYELIAEDFDRTRDKIKDGFTVFDKYLKPGKQLNHKLTIADIGCGNGRLLKHLSSLNPKPDYQYIGIDTSKKLIEIARGKYQNLPNTRFIQGDMLAIPLPGSSLDLIFNIRAFHHIPSKKLQLKALSEAIRTLKNDGRIIITVWNLWQWRTKHLIIKSFLNFILSFGQYAPNDTFIKWGRKTQRYYHGFTPSELKKLIHKSGLILEEMFGLAKDTKTPILKGHDIVIIARKP